MRNVRAPRLLTMWLVYGTLAGCGGGEPAAPSAPPAAAAPAPALAPAPTNHVPDITTTGIPAGTVGTAYAVQLAASGGDGAAVWSLASGILPAGLTLSASGLLSGTPAASGMSVLGVRVADSDPVVGAGDEDLVSLTLRVDPAVVTPPASSAVNVVVIGASTSACKNLVEGGYSLADCWVNRFSAWLRTRRPGSSVTNLAVSGTGTCHALPSTATIPPQCPRQDPHPIPDSMHNITQALSGHPDLVIVNYPHDYQIGIDPTIANLQTIQAAAMAAGVPVWITTSQPAYNDSASLASRLLQRDRVLATFGNRSIDFWTPLADSVTGTLAASLVNHYDDVHPNAEGHRLLFEAAKNTLGL